MSKKKKDCRSKIEKFLNEVDKRCYYPAMENKLAVGSVLQKNYDLSGRGLMDTCQDFKLLEQRNRR